MALVGSEPTRRRGGQAAVLGHHRRLRVLREHEARVHPRVGREERRQAEGAGRVEQPVRPPLGDPADLGDGDGEEVAREGERRAVEVPARFHAAVGEDHRVVDGRAQLGVGHLPRVGDGVARRARHLRRAAQGVGVLDAVVAVPVAGHDGGGGQQAAQVGRAVGLPGLRPEGEEVRGERAVRAQQGLHGHGRADVRDAQQVVEVVQREQQHAEHAVRAVDEREPLLGPQHERLEARRRAAPPPPAAAHRRRPRPRPPRAAPARSGPGAPGRRWRRASRAPGRPGSAPRPAARAAPRPRPAARPSGPWPACGRAGASSPARPPARRGGPMPAACERISARCSSARRSAGMTTLASEPKPVDTP